MPTRILSPVAASASPLESGQTRAQRAIEAVVAHIREMRLKAGDQLPSEAQFAAELSVSRSVIREAFGALAALHIIDVGNGRRPRVAAISANAMSISLHHAVETSQISLSEVWQVRYLLEPKAAALAASCRTAREADRIMECALIMAKCEPGSSELIAHDLEFHETIAKATRNTLLVQVLSSFFPLMIQAVPYAWRARAPDIGDALLEHHRLIAEAILQQDPAAAERAMHAHFDPSITQAMSKDA
jgi:DNA-binding FadR family transcriptional regulator